MENILNIKNLSVSLAGKRGTVPILHDISLEVEEGHILGLVGESGSGKSMTAFAITQLLPGGRNSIVGGSINFCGQELTEKTEKEMAKFRGKEIAMIFQEPMTCLNPVFTVGRQMTDVIMTHQQVKHENATKKALEMLEKVHIRNAERVLKCYPYELSGGMRQRVMIAIALSCSPKLLIADEPTTALDVTIQAQILVLIKQLQQSEALSVILVTHDLGVVAGMCDEIKVMYQGRVVEEGTTEEIFYQPQHAYTKKLLQAAHLGDKDAQLSAVDAPVLLPEQLKKVVFSDTHAIWIGEED